MPVEPLGPQAPDAKPLRRIAAHGDPGSGKTSWARSVIESVGPEHTLVVDCGGGVGVLEDVLPPECIIRLRVAEDVTKLDQDQLAAQLAVNFARAYEYVRQHLPGLEWLILDDGTSVAQGLETAGRLDMEQKRAYRTEGDKPDPFALYGALANAQFRQLVKLCQLPVNLYATYVSEIEYEQEWVIEGGKEKAKRTGRKWAAPALAGRKIMEPFIAAFDAVLYFHTKREADAKDLSAAITHYLVRTAPTPTIKAKLRSLAGRPIPDVLSIGRKLSTGVVQIGQQDWTLKRLWQEMTGSNAAGG